MIKKKSNKQIVIDREYKKMLEKFDLTTKRICTGCGQPHPKVRLSHSHIISRQHCKDYGLNELIYSPQNLTYHCLSFGEHKGCHEKWESRVERKTLLDYEKNIEFIKTINNQLYERYKNE